ncbi:MAG: N-acetylglucosamine kinase [Raineya sp.]|jgi:N-acetylglucosamine kinase-like BadF-type ATPase|nr:N-acetylglucosamine kinase [Raineya sp.]
MILIADSGSSKTDWTVLDDKQIQESFQTVGMNPYFWTTEQIIEELWANVVGHVGEQNITEIYFYGAGCSTEPKKNIVKTAFEEIFKKAHIIQIEHDLQAAAVALCGKDAGVACILGTGSNACVFDGHKITAQPINLGFWLGDEGSGGWLGKELIKAYLHQELPENLRQDLKNTYNISLEDVLENAYQKKSPNRYFASFAPFFTKNIQNEFVRNIIVQNFNLFLEKYILKMPDVQDLPIHFVGSVAFYFQEILGECLKQKKLQMGKIIKSPMEGLIEFYQKG